MKKPSPIQVVCIIQLVVAAWWAVVVSFGSPARGTIINLVFLACAALAGLQAATSSAARKIAIGLNVFEVLVWAGSLPPAIRAVSTAGGAARGLNLMIFMTIAIIVPCAISALLLIRMRKKDEFAT